MGLNIPRPSGGGGGDKGMAWFTFVVAVLGGAGLVASPVGKVVSDLAGIGPPWVPGFAFLILLAFAVRDLWKDRIPNRKAMWGAILLPTLARGTNGQLSDLITQITDQALAQMSGTLSAWIGVGGTLLAFALCVIAIIFSPKALKAT